MLFMLVLICHHICFTQLIEHRLKQIKFVGYLSQRIISQQSYFLSFTFLTES